MKTPMQELIEKLNNVKPTQFCSIETIRDWAESLLQEEKHLIIGAYEFGWDDGANNYRPVSDVIYEDGEDFYNKKFNQ